MNKNYWVVGFLALLVSACDHKEKHDYQGYVEGENLYLASPYSGAVVEACVKRGAMVKKGQLLYRLDANPQQLEILQARATLAQAEQTYNDLKKPRRPAEIAAIVAQVDQVDAQIRLATLRSKRNRELVKKQALDQDSLDASLERVQELNALKAQTEANLALAKEGSRPDQIKAQKAVLNSMAAKMRQAQWVLEQKSIHAPTDGIIFDTYYLKGEWVDTQHPVLSLLAPENMRIEFFVPVSSLAKLKLGQLITFNCQGCEKDNSAHVSYISPVAEYIPPLVYSRDNSDKLVFRVKAAIAKPLQFKPGQPVTVTVITND